MKIQIIGFGVVGKAQGHLCELLGHQFHPVDPLLPDNKMETDVDLTFLCCPERFVEENIQKMVSLGVKGLYIIKSTVPLHTTRTLMEKYKVHICHNPEFLREATSFEDTSHPSRVVIGACCPEHANILKTLYQSIDCPVYVTSSTESELIKLTSNSLRAVNISFWNEMDLLCKRAGADINVIAKCANTSDVLGKFEGGQWGTRFFGKAYGGKCLPKDLAHLENALHNAGLNPRILEATAAISELIEHQVSKRTR